MNVAQIYANLIWYILETSDLEISDRKLPQKVNEVDLEFEENANVVANNDEVDRESIGDEIEIIEKPERKDIEKKLE